MSAITQLLLAVAAYSNLALRNHTHSVQLLGLQSAHCLPSAAKGTVAVVYIIVLREGISRTNDVSKASDVMGVACMGLFSLSVNKNCGLRAALHLYMTSNPCLTIKV